MGSRALREHDALVPDPCLTVDIDEVVPVVAQLRPSAGTGRRTAARPDGVPARSATSTGESDGSSKAARRNGSVGSGPRAARARPGAEHRGRRSPDRSLRPNTCPGGTGRAAGCGTTRCIARIAPTPRPRNAAPSSSASSALPGAIDPVDRDAHHRRVTSTVDLGREPADAFGASCGRDRVRIPVEPGRHPHTLMSAWVRGRCRSTPGEGRLDPGRAEADRAGHAAASRLCCSAASWSRVASSSAWTTSSVSGRPWPRPRRVRSARTAADTARHCLDLGNLGDGHRRSRRPHGHVQRRRPSYAAYISWKSSGHERQERRVRRGSVRSVSHNVGRAGPRSRRSTRFVPEAILDDLEVVVAEHGPEELVQRFSAEA